MVSNIDTTISVSRTQLWANQTAMSPRGNQASNRDVEADQTAEMSIFRPPIVRSGTAALNRALFSKAINLAAAAVQEPKFITQYRPRLQSGRELLQVDRISPVRSHPDKALADQGRKCLLLNPNVKPEGWIRARSVSLPLVSMHADLWPQRLTHGVRYSEKASRSKNWPSSPSSSCSSTTTGITV